MGAGMASVTYREITCKSVLNPVQGKGIRWSINPYRGCAHACVYCFARVTHTYFDLNPGQDFQSIIMVKTNAPTVLRTELNRPSWRRDPVAIGSATDPYQPAEGRYRITRGILEALRDRGNPFGVVTKSTMILRDRDVLAEAAAKADVQICFSVTTLDRGLWRRIEPGTPPPWQRLRVMEQLRAAGIRAGVLLAPILPGLTDNDENLEAVVRAAVDYGAAFVGQRVLHLKSGVKEYYTGFLEREAPGLQQRYRMMYPGPFAPYRYQQEVDRRVEAIKDHWGMRRRPEPLKPREVQLRLVDAEVDPTVARRRAQKPNGDWGMTVAGPRRTPAPQMKEMVQAAML